MILTTTKFFFGGGAFLSMPRKSRISESKCSSCFFAPVNLFMYLNWIAKLNT